MSESGYFHTLQRVVCHFLDPRYRQRAEPGLLPDRRLTAGVAAHLCRRCHRYVCAGVSSAARVWQRCPRDARGHLQPGRRLLDVGARRMAERSAMLVDEVFPHQPCAIISPTREICGLGIYRGRTLILSIRISMGWLWVFSLQNSIRADGGIRQNSLIILHSPRK